MEDEAGDQGYREADHGHDARLGGRTEGREWAYTRGGMASRQGQERPMRSDRLLRSDSRKHKMWIRLDAKVTTGQRAACGTSFKSTSGV